MELRKIVIVGNACAVTLPKAFMRVLNVAPSDYVELYLNDKNTLVIRKHVTVDRRRSTDGK